QARISTVQAQRSADREDYFARMDGSIETRQDLIDGLPQYRDSVVALLEALNFDAHATALEVGPGDGSFLPELAGRFTRVTALDNSLAMLQLAKAHCERQTLGNVELKLADAL